MSFKLFANPIPGFFVQEPPASSFGKFFLDKSTIVTLGNKAYKFSPGRLLLGLSNLDPIAEVQQLGGCQRVEESRVKCVVINRIPIVSLLAIR